MVKFNYILTYICMYICSVGFKLAFNKNRSMYILRNMLKSTLKRRYRGVVITFYSVVDYSAVPNCHVVTAIYLEVKIDQKWVNSCNFM